MPQIALNANINGANITNTAWAVDGIVNGNTSVGTITGSNPVVYTPPTTSGNHVITASLTVNIPGAVSTTVAPTTANILGGGTLSLTSTILGTTNLATNWYVDGVLNGNATVGTITQMAGLKARQNYLSTTKSQSVNVVVGDLIYVGYACDENRFNAPITCADSAGNTYRPIGAGIYVPSPGDVSLNAFYAIAKSSGTITVTITVANPVTIAFFVKVEQGNFGTVDTVLDNFITSIDSSISTVHTSGILKTNNASDLVIAFWVQNQNGPTLAEKATGFTVDKQNINAGMFSKIVTATGSYYDTVQTNNSTKMGCILAAFKAASTASGNSAIYTAPAAGGSHTITATSVADNTKSATCAVTINAVGVSVTPKTANMNTGASTAITATPVNTTLAWDVDGITNGNSSVGTLSVSGNTATYTAPSTAGSHTITATAIADNTKFDSCVATVAAPNSVVSVTLNNSSVSLMAGISQSLTATVNVTGSAATTVTWTVDGIAGGNSTVGLITGTGNTVTYTAPAASGTHSIVATSTVDSSKHAACSVAVSANVVASVSSVALNPTTLTVSAGNAASITVTVTNAGNASTSVTWKVDGITNGDATVGTISVNGNIATYTAPATTGNHTITATSTFDTSKSASAAVTVVTSVGTAGFNLLSAAFPSPSQFASGRTATAASANPWMKGARFAINNENICLASAPSNTWSAEAAAFSGYTKPAQIQLVMERLVGDPESGWDIASANSVTYMDQSVAGAVQIAVAAGITNFLFDPENYGSDTGGVQAYMNSFGSIVNSGGYNRTQMCAKMRAWGAAFGHSLWSRVANASLYMFFGPTQNMSFNGPGIAGVPSSVPDSAYAGDSWYNLYPYFCLGLLDSCPTTGRIIDYMETGSYYGFTGKKSLQRLMYASKNWVSIYFPNESANITKAATCWIPVPLMFPNPYFDANYDPATIYPGAHYVTSSTDQANYFTRNCLAALQMCPSGYMPGIYMEDVDPWGAFGSVIPVPTVWQTCLNNALAVYNGSIALSSLFDIATLDAHLASDLSANSIWANESATI